MVSATAEPEELVLREAVDKALHGDGDAWEALYVRIRPRLFALCMRRLGNREDAEDAVAETMLRAVRGANTFRWRDAGFDAYAVLVTNHAWVEKNPEKARAFLKAYIRGWKDYIEGDPAPAHALMKKLNPHNTDEFLAFSRRMIIDEKLAIGRHAGDDSQTGRISRERFVTQIRQLEEIGILPKGRVDVDQVMSTEYLPP